MNFYTSYDTVSNDTGKQFYLLDEESFHYKSNLETDFSIMLGAGYISLETDLQNGQVHYLSGFCSRETWQDCNLVLPGVKNGTLYVETENSDMMSGTGLYLSENTAVFYDNYNNWICIGEPVFNEKMQGVCFNENLYAFLCKGQLTSVWTKPIFCDSEEI